MTRDYQLVALAGNLHPAAVNGASSRRLPFNVSKERAIAVAVDHASSATSSPADLIVASRDLAGFKVLEVTAGNVQFIATIGRILSSRVGFWVRAVRRAERAPQPTWQPTTARERPS